MLAAGLDPLALALVEGDRARDQLLAAVERLKAFRALSGAPSGKLSITELGRKLARLPLDLNLALCVLAAAEARLACSNEVAIIACVAQMASLNLFDRGDSGKAAKARYAAPSGDHETYLAVFEAWVKGKKMSSFLTISI
jgi:HrpA-like RNA helicase